MSRGALPKLEVRLARADGSMLVGHLVEHRGRIGFETMHHSPVGYGVAAGVLEHDDVHHHEERHLLLNCVGSREMRVEIGALIRAKLGEEYWTMMQTYHRQAIRFGLYAPQPGSDLLSSVLTLAEAALARRGFGEERLIAPLWRRLDRRMNPAQRARVVFRHDGMAGMLSHATIRPGQVKR